jgi:peroxiredoxin
VASVSLNVALALRVRTLSQVQSSKAAERLLKRDTVVPPIVANRVGGQREIISYQGNIGPTVLYVFTPPCSWCARNMDNFKTLVAKESRTYRFVGLSLSDEGLAEYVSRNELQLAVYSGLSPEMLKAYKLGSTPQTIVISPEGKVLQDWVGAYVGDQKSQIEAFFHVSLPGLRELPKAQAARN